jgi:histidinol-phosphate aminotransferase
MSAPTCDVLDLLREDLREFAGYRSARSEAVSGAIWLNANEAAYANIADDGGCLRRYPSPQPDSLRCALADQYD